MSSTQSIKSSREAAHRETMWGKPANDIVVGIGNIRTVPASRGIWELVQNALMMCRARLQFPISILSSNIRLIML